MLTLVDLKGLAGPKAMPTYADGTASFTFPIPLSNYKIR